MKLVTLNHIYLNKTTANIFVTFPEQNGLKQGDAESPSIFNFALEYTVRKVSENRDRVGIEWGIPASDP